MIRHLPRILSLTIGMALTGLSTWPQTTPALSRIDELLAVLQNDRATLPGLGNLEDQPIDPRTLPALKVAFERRKEKEDRQRIAATLVRLGERTGPYFDFLIHYATVAIEDGAPFCLRYDTYGHSVRGELNAAFLNWCAQNGQDQQAIARRQLHDYPKDVLTLAEVDDLRSRDVLRRGLDSPNELVVAFSVQGLGRIHDCSAVPLIATSLKDRPIDAQNTVALQLPWFGTSDAQRIMERIISDRALREAVTGRIEQQRFTELKRALKRNSGTTQK